MHLLAKWRADGSQHNSRVIAILPNGNIKVYKMSKQSPFKIIETNIEVRVVVLSLDGAQNAKILYSSVSPNGWSTMYMEDV